MMTTVSLNKTDFSHFQVQADLHVVISVKDFKAIVTHAQALDAVLNALYSDAGRPLQFVYKKGAVLCQYTLMTSGENRALPTANAPSSNRRAPSVAATSFSQPKPASTAMPPPPRPRDRNMRSLGRRDATSDSGSAAPTGKEESLFVSQDEDEDRAWDPPNYETSEETLGWDASGVGVCEIPSHRYLLTLQESLFTQRLQDKRAPAPETATAQQQEWPDIMSPTQRLSQVCLNTVLCSFQLTPASGPETVLDFL
jgi:cell cycle checkpoint control protein RAD9A